MKKRNLIFLFSCFILCMLSITGCSNSQEDSIGNDIHRQDMDAIDDLPMYDNNYDTMDDNYDSLTNDSIPNDSHLDDNQEHHLEDHHYNDSTMLDDVGDKIEDAFDDVKDGAEHMTDDIKDDANHLLDDITDR